MSVSIERPGIAVGVDGSPASRVAVDWAARDAAMRDVPLTLVHVANGVVAPWSRTPLPTGSGNGSKSGAAKFIDDAIRVAKEATKRTGQVQVRTEMYYSATVPTLVDISKDVEMIVVGRRGQGAFGSLLGSVSAGLVQHAHCPVAVIHDEDPLMPHPAQAPVLVGIDGSPISELATAIAFDEASRRHVDLIALHAWSDTGVLDFPGMDWSTMKSSEDEVLAERLAGWQERYPDVNGSSPGGLRSAGSSAHRALGGGATGRGRQSRPWRVRRHAAGFGQRGRGSVSPDAGDRRTPALATQGVPGYASLPGLSVNRIVHPARDVRRGRGIR